MKKYLLPLWASLCCMAACQKEETGILNLEVERYASEGKMHLDDEHYAVWDDGDTIHFEGTPKIVTVSNGKATISDVAAAESYHAIYPNSWATSNNTILYPAVQRYRTNGQGKQVIDAPMVALCEEGSSTLYFHNVGSILKVGVTNNTGDVMKVRRIEVTSESTPICGSTTVDYTDFTLSGPTDGGSTVTLDIKEGVSVPSCSTAYFYIALPPVTAKLTIKVYDDAFSYTKSQTTSHAMLKNHGYTAPINTSDATAVQFAPTSKQIWYTTTDDNAITSSKLSTNGNGPDNGLHCNVMTFSSDITSIPEGAFAEASTLKTITLPSSVTSIGSDAFHSCTVLTTVKMPGVTSIRSNAFNGCTALTTIEMPSVTSIGDKAFYDCDAFTNLTLPDGVTTIGTYAFQHCDQLVSITLPSGVTSIGSGAFKECTALNNINIPYGVESIGNYVFKSCTTLVSLTIPGSVTSIGEEAFAGCTGLSSLTIPSSVTSIGNRAFNGSGLTSLTIPGSVETITPAFVGCTSLTSLTISEGVKTINADAFKDCTALGTVSIPASVTTLYAAFDGCTSLTEITYAGTMDQWNNVGKLTWTSGSRIAIVHCSDGKVNVNGGSN